MSKPHRQEDRLFAVLLSVLLCVTLAAVGAPLWPGA